MFWIEAEGSLTKTICARLSHTKGRCRNEGPPRNINVDVTAGDPRLLHERKRVL
jgi:hypothetical protein